TALSPDGEFLANGWAWNTVFPVTVWSLATGEQVIESDHGRNRVNAVAFGADAQRRTRYIATASDDTFAGVWDLLARRKVTRLKQTTPVRAVAFERGASRLLTAANDGTLCLWRTSDWQKVAELRSQLTPAAITFGQGETFAVADARGEVQIWKAKDGTWAIA